LNLILRKIIFTPQKLVLVHVALGLLFAILPQLFIPFFYLLLIISFNWIFSNNRAAKNMSIVVTVFFYLMMFESVGRLLGLDPFIPWELGKYLNILFFAYQIYKQKIRFRFLVVMGLLLILIMLIKGVTWRGFFFNGTMFLGLLLTQESLKTIKFSKNELLRLLKTLLLPLFVFLGASINQIQDFQNRQYELGSNSILDKIPSNQVATYMGFAFFLSVLPFFFTRGYSRKWTSYISPSTFLFIGLLSFSRGGMITAVIGLIVILFGNIISGKINYLIYLTFFLIFSVLIALFINEATGGNLFLRYKGETQGTLVGSKEVNIDTYSTGRVSIFLGDWETFKDNWVFGVKIGESRHYRKETEQQHSHVELSRVLAEHGLLGAISFFSLVLHGLVMFVRRSEFKPIRYLVLAIWIVGLVTTFHGASRTIIPFVCLSISVFSIVNKSVINRTIHVKN